jgi:hypothetical protein
VNKGGPPIFPFMNISFFGLPLNFWDCVGCFMEEIFGYKDDTIPDIFNNRENSIT